MINLGERLTEVKDTLPPPPAGVPEDERHRTANALHSAALRLLRRARAADVTMDLDGRARRPSRWSCSPARLPIGRLAALEQVSPPAITKTVTALESDGLVERVRSGGDRRVVLVRATAGARAAGAGPGRAGPGGGGPAESRERS
jgi:DNA-binding transcriptional ArsR family regulator